MCEIKAQATTRIERLIAAMNRLAAALERFPISPAAALHIGRDSVEGAKHGPDA